MQVDLVVVGGGIVGLATAMAMQQRRPGASVVVLEKEHSVARHQTGHNSGVVHSGIYYPPGSFKAALCRRGAEATKAFCAAHDLPVLATGKLIVATDQLESRRLADLEARAGANGIEVSRLSGAELASLEPHVRGAAALLVPQTAAVDYVGMSQAMAQQIRSAGGQVVAGVRVDGIAESSSRVDVRAGDRQWSASRMVACAGLQSDRIAKLAGIDLSVRVVPFRGEYFSLPASRAGMVRRMIYPVPDPRLPFLGVHLTPMVDGSITLGPNAVLGLAREGYRKGSVNLQDLRDIVSYAGFWRVARRHTYAGAIELRNSLLKRGYLQACRRYCPALELADLQPREAGIRAQAVSPDGQLLQDFAFEQTDRTLHVVNAPSPAATAALPIGELVVGRLLQRHTG